MRTGPESAGTEPAKSQAPAEGRRKKLRVAITVEEPAGAAADAPVRTGPGSAGQRRGLKTIEWGHLWLPNEQTKRIDARIAAEEAAGDAASVM